MDYAVCPDDFLDFAAIGTALSEDPITEQAVTEVVIGSPIALSISGKNTIPVILSVHVDANGDDVTSFINWLKGLKKDFDISVEFGYPAATYVLGLTCSPLLARYLELLPGAHILGNKTSPIRVFDEGAIQFNRPARLGTRPTSPPGQGPRTTSNVPPR